MLFVMAYIFVQAPTTYPPTQHDQHGPDNPFRTINYHQSDISGQDGIWMSRILVGEMASADEDYGMEVGVLWLFLSSNY
jgi:hypothetical protein